MLTHLKNPPLAHFLSRKSITKSQINVCLQCPFPHPRSCPSLVQRQSTAGAMDLTRSPHTVALPSTCHRFCVTRKKKWRGEGRSNDNAATYQIKTFQLLVNTPNSQHRIESVCRREQDQAALCPRLVLSRIDGISLTASQSVLSMYSALNPSKGVRSGMDFF